MNGLVLTQTQISNVFHQAELALKATDELVPEVTRTVGDLIEMVPHLRDEQLLPAYRQGLKLEHNAAKLDHNAWRLRAVVAAQIINRESERRARGRHDTQGQAIKEMLLQLAKEAGVGTNTLYKDARIVNLLPSSVAGYTRETAPDGAPIALAKEFYVEAIKSPEPQAALEYFKEQKSINPEFSKRDAREYVKQQKQTAPPEPRPLQPQYLALQVTLQTFQQISAELERLAANAQLNLSPLLSDTRQQIKAQLQPVLGPVETRLAALKESSPHQWVITVLEMVEAEMPTGTNQDVRAARMRFAARLQRTEDSDRQAILKALQNAEVELTVSEISGDTDIPGNTVYKRLEELIAQGLVGRKQGQHAGIGQGGDRTSYLYFLRAENSTALAE